MVAVHAQLTALCVHVLLVLLLCCFAAGWAAWWLHRTGLGGL